VEAWAIVVAAGRGERLAAGRPKAFVTLRGRTLLEWSLRACEASRAVVHTVVVGPPDHLDECRAVALHAEVAKPTVVVAGGAERQDSVRAGLRAVSPGFAGVVLVHDAARPLADGALFDAVAAAAAAEGAAVPVIPLVDTIKRVAHGRVTATVDRAELFAAQTPQGFRRALLDRAYAGAEAGGAPLTDEAMAVERLGEAVTAVKGVPRNRKMTTADDLRWAEDLLRREGPP
jgi:2-C-methyl-D-erythritol 4-phosphate cytidylyltransferase